MKDKLKQFIGNSNMSDADKELWYSIVDKNEDFEAGILLEALEENPELIAFFNKNVKDKMEATSSADPKKWDTILKEEEQYLAAE